MNIDCWKKRNSASYIFHSFLCKEITEASTTRTPTHDKRTSPTRLLARSMNESFFTSILYLTDFTFIMYGPRCMIRVFSFPLSFYFGACVNCQSLLWMHCTLTHTHTHKQKHINQYIQVMNGITDRRFDAVCQHNRCRRCHRHHHCHYNQVAARQCD